MSETTTNPSTSNPVRALLGAGQSPWLDQLRREWLESGQLADWLDADGLRGVTSNPSIFREAIATSDAYDAEHRALIAEGLSTREVYDRLTLTDIQGACDVFRPIWNATDGADGFVSHEVSPDLADDTWGTIHEARRLWQAVGRPNVMIKIPATPAGIPAVSTCLAEGININITLMFSLAHYDAVAEAYLSGVEARLAAGHTVDRLASVASFFVSRVDTLVDKRLAAQATGGSEDPGLAALRGQAAIANSQLAYQRFARMFTGARFGALAVRGARVQRVLWASTSTKNPAYRDVRYVEELIGPDTVNTMPLATLEAFRDHGRVARTVDADPAAADDAVRALAERGIDLNEVGETLSRDGVRQFAEAQAAVLAAIDAKRSVLAPAVG